MTELLIRLFVKNSAETKDPAVRSRYGALSGMTGIAVNLLLSGLKLLVGLLSASVAIVADALNNLSDAGSSIISLISFRISAKPADKDHPFGHARMEYIASMIVSFLILIVGFELFSGSFSSLVGLSEREAVDVSWLTIIILSLSILGKLWLALFYRKVAKRIDSSVIRASSADSLSDCVSTGAVLISSIIIHFTDFYLVDSIVGLAVSVLILIAGIKILNETKNSLLGEAPVEEVVSNIKEVVSRYPEALGVHDMMVHNYGPNHFIASLHVEVDGKDDIFKLHDVIDQIEVTIYSELGILCTIHMDPIVTDDERVSELREFVTGVVREIDPALSIHDFRTVIGETHTNLIFDIVLPFDSKETPESVSEKTKSAVLAARPNHFCVITVDRG